MNIQPLDVPERLLLIKTPQGRVIRELLVWESGEAVRYLEPDFIVLQSRERPYTVLFNDVRVPSATTIVVDTL